MFHSMTRHLTSGRPFRLWLAKCWEFDPGLTIKFMRAHRDRFGREEIDYYNTMARLNGKERFML